MEENQETPSKPKQIFILSGQSNMSGRGGVNRHRHQHQKHWDGIIPQECKSQPDILRLTANLEWVTAHEPLHADIDDKKVCGVGPGMSFANAVRDHGGGGGVIGLVPCAVGGTAIKEWARGEKLYENMVTRAKESVKDGCGGGGGGGGRGEIKCLLWYQGESDTFNEHDADVYQENMEKFVANVREDLDLPSLPIIQVAITSGDEKYLEKVREAQLKMNISNVVCVDAKGLQLKEDNLHLTTHSQVKLGQMLAEAYLKHFAANPSPTPTPSM
ncbi:probable carbohydrate esterase At4g34215 [Mercurialis annua]|uniref:probable carbohydrate esterase At4g34215 n=1 Tax=Mercurialis annua TaxID=3986 RepID=UPI00215FF7D7|nr:probable carbohydrate esterase At4g34215 [Mercurialis annua]